MEGVRELLEILRRQELVSGNFRALLHILIGRRITRSDGTLISQGVTWRELAGLLKAMRWDREIVRELGIDPDELPPRDRQRFWFTAITLAAVGTTEARMAADVFAEALVAIGYHVGAAPGTSSS